MSTCHRFALPAVLLLLLLVSAVNAQFTNVGRDFYFCYPGNAFRHTEVDTVGAEGEIIVTATVATTGSITNRSGTFNVPFAVAANGTATIPIPNSYWLTTTEIIENLGFRIQADQDITAYFLTFDLPRASNDLALLYPITSTGRDYIVLGYEDNARGSLFSPSVNPSMMAIASPTDGTVVTITPKCDTEGGHSAGVPFSITLNAYQTYQILATSPLIGALRDLSGTQVHATNPISVFSGSTCTTVPASVGYADYLLEQIPPQTALGRTFLAIPTMARMTWTGDVLRILASEDSTDVTIQNSALGTINVRLNRGQMYKLDGPCVCTGLAPCLCTGPFMTVPTYINASEPVLVGQYMVGSMLVDYRNVNPWGDPSYNLVPPVEQYADRYIYLIPPDYQYDYVNVAIPSGHEASVQIDGVPVGVTWLPMPTLPYLGAKISVTDGSHIINADTTFMLIIYGMNQNNASYASLGGTNLAVINPEYSMRKRCLTTPVYTGTEATWQIVMVMRRGDPSTGVTLLDTLPNGFHFLRMDSLWWTGSATRTGSINPNIGDQYLTWGSWSMRAGDTLVVRFTASIDNGVLGTFDNGITMYNGTGQTSSNFGGLDGPDDDVEVIRYPVAFTLDIISPEDGYWSGCVPQAMILGIGIDTGAVDPTSLIFTVARGPEMPVPYTVDGTRLVWNGTQLTFNPPPGFVTDGQSVRGCLSAGRSMNGDSIPGLPFCWSWAFDAFPPVIDGWNPAIGETITTGDAIISFRMMDSGSGIDRARTLITINGISYPESDLRYTGDSVRIDPARFGLRWDRSDTVRICLTAYDRVDTCGHNTNTCVTYVVRVSEPYASILQPLNDSTTACAGQTIRMILADPLVAIDPASIRLVVNGVTHTVGDGRLTFTDTLLTFTPLPVWTDGESVSVSLTQAQNSLGRSISSLPITWFFRVDLTPPFAQNPVPAGGTTLPYVPGTFSVEVLDTLSGLNVSSLAFTVNGVPVRWGDVALNYGGTTATLDLTLLGPFDDSIIVCLTSATDGPDYCSPNALTPQCWRIYLRLDGPVGSLFNPPAGAISSCEAQVLLFRLFDPDSVDPNSIVIRFDGRLYTAPTPEIGYTSGNLAFMPPTGLYLAGDTVHYAVIAATDLFGNPMTDSIAGWFVYDPEVPILTDFAPWPGETLVTVTPTFTFRVRDLIAGLNTDSLTFTIDGHVYRPGMTGVTFTPGGNVALDCSLLPLTFSGGDSVSLCVRALDRAGYCGVNILDTCFTYYIAAGGPDAVIVEPRRGSWSACDDQVITMYLIDPNGVDPASIRLMVNGTTYQVGDGFLTYGDTTLVWAPPSGFFTDNALVAVSLTAAADLIGNPIFAPTNWTFRVDLTPPVASNIAPPAGLLALVSPTFSVDLTDAHTNIRADSIYFHVAGTRYRVGVVPGSSWAAPTARLNCAVAGISLTDGDSVQVCIEAYDEPDYCPGNPLLTCWWYLVSLSGPRAVMVTPTPGDYSACPTQNVVLEITDPEGIIANSIRGSVAGTTFAVGDGRTNWNVATHQLTWTPPAGTYTDGESVLVVLTAANDSLGNTLSGAPVTFWFRMDLTGPVPTAITPPPGGSVAEDSPALGVTLTDSGSGPDSTTVCLRVNGTRYCLGSSCATWTRGADFHSGTINLPRGCVTLVPGANTICVEATDQPDLCGPNALDSCWTLDARLIGPTAALIRPDDGTSSACSNQGFAISLDDSDGVDPASIRINIAGTDYTLPNPLLNYSRRALTFTPPAGMWTHGTTVTVNLTAADDMLGNHLQATLRFSYRIDLQPPHIVDPHPIPGTWEGSLTPDVWCLVQDDFTGVSTAGLQLQLTTPRSFFTYRFGDANLSWTADTLRLNTRRADVRIQGGDSIQICVHAVDMPDTCGPNVMDTCWVFHISAGGPVAQPLNPVPGIVSACSTQSIAIRVTDPEGDGLNWISARMDVAGRLHGDYAGTSYIAVDTYTWVPTPPFVDGDTVRAVFYGVTDSLLNPLSGDSLVITFMLDFSPPYLISTSPLNGATILVRSPDIRATIGDVSSGQVFDTIRINGTAYPATDSCVTLNDSSITFSTSCSGIIFRGGDMVQVCIVAHDTPTSGYCVPNRLDTCWSFNVLGGGPMADLLEPDSNSISACSLQVIRLRFTDSLGMDPASIVVLVDGDTLSRTSTGVSWANPDWTYRPPTDWTDGATIAVRVTSARDSLGNPLQNPFDFSFRLDLAPPVVTDGLPVDTITVWQPAISAAATDNLLGVDSTTLAMTFSEVFDFAGPQTFRMGDAGMTWAGGRVSFDPRAVPHDYTPEDSLDGTGVYFPELTPITVTVTATENRPDYCTARTSIPYTWTFVLADDDTTGPVLVSSAPSRSPIETPVTVVLVVGDSSGLDTSGVTLLWDTDGSVTDGTASTALLVADSVWTVDGVTYVRFHVVLPGQPAGTVTWQVTFTDADRDFRNPADTSQSTFGGTIAIQPGPEVMIDHPLSGGISTCARQEIRWIVRGTYGFDRSTFSVSIGGHLFTYPADTELTAVDSVVTFHPALDYPTGMVVIAYAVDFRDTLGNPLAVADTLAFTVDLASPSLSFVAPGENAIVRDLAPNLVFRFHDSPAGVRDSGVCVTFRGVNYCNEDIQLVYDDPAETSGTATLVLKDHGVLLEAGDTVCGSFRADDAPSVTDCPANRTDLPFCFYVEPRTECRAAPNPFTPNADGTNDGLLFTYPNLSTTSVTVEIFTMRNLPVRKFSITPTDATDLSKRVWRGEDDSNQPVQPGVYLYVIKNGGTVVCSGTVLLAR